MSDFTEQLVQQIPRLRRYARALTRDRAWADDLVQDTLERALQRRWLFRLNSDIGSWTLTILHRLYLNSASRTRRMLPEEAIPEDSVATSDGLGMDIRQALECLSPEHRAVIVLIGLEQVSYKEAAGILGVPVGTVMSRLSRAREQLRERLTGIAATAGASTAHLTRVK